MVASPPGCPIAPEWCLRRCPLLRGLAPRVGPPHSLVRCGGLWTYSLRAGAGSPTEPCRTIGALRGYNLMPVSNPRLLRPTRHGRIAAEGDRNGALWREALLSAERRRESICASGGGKQGSERVPPCRTFDRRAWGRGPKVLQVVLESGYPCPQVGEYRVATVVEHPVILQRSGVCKQVYDACQVPSLRHRPIATHVEQEPILDAVRTERVNGLNVNVIAQLRTVKDDVKFRR